MQSDPALSTEHSVTMRTKPSELMGGRCITNNTQQNHTDTSSVRSLVSFYDYPFLPKAQKYDYPFLPKVQKIIDQWSHISLDLIRTWLFWTRHNTGEQQVQCLISRKGCQCVQYVYLTLRNTLEMRGEISYTK